MPSLFDRLKQGAGFVGHTIKEVPAGFVNTAKIPLNIYQLGAQDVLHGPSSPQAQQALQRVSNSYQGSIPNAMITPAWHAVQAAQQTPAGNPLWYAYNQRQQNIKNQQAAQADQQAQDAIHQIQRGVQMGQIPRGDAANAINEASKYSQAFSQNKEAGYNRAFLNAGFNPTDSPFTVGRKFVSNAGQTALNVASLGAASELAPAKTALGRVLQTANNSGKFMAGASTVGALGQDQVKPADLIKAPIAGYLQGAALAVGLHPGEAVKAGGEVAKTVGEKIPQQRFAGLKANEIITKPENLQALQAYQRSLGGKGELPVKTQQRVLDAMHDVKNTNGLDFLSGSKADRAARIGQYLDQHQQALPAYQEHLSRPPGLLGGGAMNEGGYIKNPLANEQPPGRYDASIERPNPEVPAEARGLADKPARADFMDTTNRFLGSKESAKTNNVIALKQLPRLDTNQSLGLMDAIESGAQAGDFSGLKGNIRQILDAKHQQLQAAGVDIGYLQDYFPHKWQDEAKVARDYQALNLRAGIQNPRELPTIAEGMKLGFKPLTTDYREALYNYLNTADKLLANRQYFSDLKSKGLIAEAGTRPQGMQVIDAPGLPSPRPFTDQEAGLQIQGNYYARPDVAKHLNKLFGVQDSSKILKGTAKTSSMIQQLTLAGGAPGTPLNSFGIAQWTKQALSGRPISATRDFFRSFSPKASDRYFADNADYITKMQNEGVPFRASINDPNTLKSFGQQIADSTTAPAKVKVTLREGWNALVEDPTFQRFLPAMQLDTFKGIYDRMVKQGADEATASRTAAEATRNAFGLNSLAKDALRSATARDVSSTFLFAPRFRESMVNFWVDNLKALGHPTSPAYRENVKFLAGATMLFGGMQAANYAINGHSTFSNENPNDRLNLSIPTGEGRSVSIPFLSSIATVPRMAVNAGVDLATGRPKDAGLESKKVLSQLVRPAVDLAFNQKYNGRPVYTEKADAGKRLAQQASYVAGQYNHPYIQAGVGVVNGTTSGPLETAATATELPLRFRDAYKYPQTSGGTTIEKSAENPTGSKKVADALSTDSAIRWNNFTTKTREVIAKRDPNKYLHSESTRIQNDLASGAITQAKAYTQARNAQRVAISAPYGQEVQDAYQLSKTGLTDMLSSLPGQDASKLASRLKEYDNALLGAGLITTAKYAKGLTSATKKGVSTARRSTGRARKGTTFKAPAHSNPYKTLLTQRPYQAKTASVHVKSPVFRTRSLRVKAPRRAKVA